MRSNNRSYKPALGKARSSSQISARLDQLVEAAGLASEQLHIFTVASDETRKQAVRRYERETGRKIAAEDLPIGVKKFCVTVAELKATKPNASPVPAEPARARQAAAPGEAATPALELPARPPGPSDRWHEAFPGEAFDKAHGAISNSPEVVARLERQQLTMPF